MPSLILGLLFLAFGAVSIVDAQRIASTIRKRGTLDLVGPDGYLQGAAYLLIFVGLLLVVKGVIEWRRSRDAVPTTRSIADEGLHAREAAAAEAPGPVHAGGGDLGSTSRHIALLGVLVAYAVLLPLAGYAVSTVAALAALFRIMGVSGWLRVALWAIGTAVVFYVGFVVIADLPLPKGWLKLG